MIKIIEKTLDDFIGKPSDYCEWVGEPEYKDIKKIIISCNTGTGNTAWTEYVEDFEIKDLGKFIKVYSVEKEKDIILNQNYIVSVEDMTLMTCKFVSGDKIRNYYILIEFNKRVNKIEKETYHLYKKII